MPYPRLIIWHAQSMTECWFTGINDRIIMRPPIVTQSNWNFMRVLSMENINWDYVIVIYLDRSIVKFGNSLNLQVITETIWLALSLKVMIKILRNILRKMLPIFILIGMRKFNVVIYHIIDNLLPDYIVLLLITKYLMCYKNRWYSPGNNLELTNTSK